MRTFYWTPFVECSSSADAFVRSDNSAEQSHNWEEVQARDTEGLARGGRGGWRSIETWGPLSNLVPPLGSTASYLVVLPSRPALVSHLPSCPDTQPSPLSPHSPFSFYHLITRSWPNLQITPKQLHPKSNFWPQRSNPPPLPPETFALSF